MPDADLAGDRAAAAAADTSPIPYARQVIDEDDVQAVVAVLRGGWLTTGPAVADFEERFAAFVGAEHAVSVATGTAALHLSLLAAGIGPGDEVIVPALTFVASANAARYVGAEVVFADVHPDTLTLDPRSVAALITPRTRAIVAVDYAGLPCDLHELQALADRHQLLLVEDACHAPGATYRGQRVGSIAHLTCFSFHPVKHLTTGEGGMVTTADPALADRLRRLRNHGIDADPRVRAAAGTWAYDVTELGFNFRLPDLSAALGASQLTKLPGWLERRAELAARYDRHLADLGEVRRPHVPEDRTSAWHLYPVRVAAAAGGTTAARRRAVYTELHRLGVLVNVHYRPVHQLGLYRQLGYPQDLAPVAEAAYDGLLSLPMWPGLTTSAQDRVIGALAHALEVTA